MGRWHWVRLAKELEEDTEPPADIDEGRVDTETGEITPAAEPPSKEEIEDGEERAEYIDPVPEEERPASRWPDYTSYTEVPKVGDGPAARQATRQELTHWIVLREKQCEAKALAYPACPEDGDDLALANHLAQLKAIVEGVK